MEIHYVAHLRRNICCFFLFTSVAIIRGIKSFKDFRRKLHLSYRFVCILMLSLSFMNNKMYSAVLG